MPLYEYRCKECRRRTTVLVRGFSEPSSLTCEHCGSASLLRLISGFAFHRSFGESLDWVPDAETLGDVDKGDPRAYAGWLRHMKNEMGEEVTPEFDEMVDELEAEAEKPQDQDVEEANTPLQ